MSDYEDADYDYYPEKTDQDYEYEDNVQLYRQNSISILQEKEVSEIRENFIKKAINRVELPRDSIILALILFKWDVERFAETWYDNGDKYCYEAGISLSPIGQLALKKQKVVNNNTECSVCYTSKSDLLPENFIALSCNHYFCKDCWKEYLSEKLKEINTVILTHCPQVGCSLITTESIFKSVLDEKAYSQYIKACIKNFTDFNSVIKSCPTPGCESYIQCEAKGNKEVTCIHCEETYCFKCMQDGHKPCTCEMIVTWESKNKSESENIKWLNIYTKKCPHCHKHIEKNQGCNHMTCQKQAGGCGHEFCWLCMGNWKGHNACNKYEPPNETKTQNLKHELDKYIHYFDRYMNYRKSQGFARSMRPSIEEYIFKFNTEKLIPYIDLKFLLEGWKTILNSRKTLKNSYIFGFYLKDKSPHKSLFEFHQHLLESYSDKLHGLLENNMMSTLLALEELEEFNDNFKLVKNQVVDLYSATNKFMTNLLESIELSMIDQIDYKYIKNR